MPTALLGAIDCRRCGRLSTPGADCTRCAAAGLPAAPGSVVQGVDAPMVGAVPAGLLRRGCSALIDAALVVAAAAVVFVTLSSSPEITWLITASVTAVVVLAAQLAALARWGRTPGRHLLGVRAVDDLTGCAPGWRRLILSAARRSVRTVDVDIRHGRDPLTGRRPLE